MILSVLIPTLKDREQKFAALLVRLNHQRNKLAQRNEIEILSEYDSGEKTIGEKRQILMDRATGKYICYFDDDDQPTDKYLYWQLQACLSGLDCGTFKGNYYERGKLIKPFKHELKYKYAWDDPFWYFRFPNHLNVMKKELVKDFKFQHKNFGEDNEWAERISNAGVLKTEFVIPEVIYNYYK